MANGVSSYSSSHVLTRDSVDESIIIELQRAYRDLVKKFEETEEIDLMKIIDFQDRLNRVQPSLYDNSIYREIVEGIEALSASVIASEGYFRTSLSCFEYKNKHYAVKLTRGQGSCPIHALLGEEINGVFRFPGVDAFSSSAAKLFFTKELKTALKVKRSVRQIFCEVICGYLAASDCSARKLFGTSETGLAIKHYWNNLKSFYDSQIDAVNRQEASEWLKVVEKENNRVLTQIIAALEQNSPYYGMNDQELLQIFRENSSQLLRQVNEQPEIFIALLDEPHTTAILELRKGRRKLITQHSQDKESLALSEIVVKHYITIICDPSFFLNTNEIKLAAYIFEKNVLIVVQKVHGIEPTELIQGSSSSKEPVVIHHHGSHFSRCVRIDPPPQTTPGQVDFIYQYTRETRPDLVCPGVMRVKNFNPETHELELEFTSAEQVIDFSHMTAGCMAAFGHYAIAKAVLQEKNYPPSLGWTRKALEKTAMQLRAEKGKKFRAEDYEKHAGRLVEKVRQTTRDFCQIIANMKKLLKPPYSDSKMLDKFFENWQEATRIEPNRFAPHELSLFLIPALSYVNPQMALFFVKKAHKCSPQFTFNSLVKLFLLKFISIQDAQSQVLFRTFSQLFFECFPYDLRGHMLAVIANKSKEAEEQERYSRQAFSKFLGEALDAILRGNLAMARKKFLTAECYHISDKRSYHYRALIDLMQDNGSSALKLIIASQHLIDWQEPVQLDFSLDEESPGKLEKHEQLETPLLKSILDLYRFPKKTEVHQCLITSMQKYLLDPHKDLIWAKLAIDLAKKLLNNNPKVWLELFKMFIASTYGKLNYLKEDLSGYSEVFSIENNQLSIHRSITHTWQKYEPVHILIDLSSLQISQEIVSPLLKQLLRESYDVYNLYPIQQGALNQISEWKVTDTDCVLYGPFVKALIERMNVETDIELRCKILQWAIGYVHIWPSTYLQPLTDCIVHWQLQRPVFNQRMHRQLVSLEKRWLEVSGQTPSSTSGALGIAKKAWDFLHVKKYEEAKSEIGAFFANWEDSLNFDVDSVALVILCAVRVLLKHPKLFETMPSTVKSKYHTSLIWSVLSILAREGAEKLCVIPNQELSENVIKVLCHFYTAKRRNESDADYSKRLGIIQIPHTADLRRFKRFSLSAPEEGWVFPPTRVDLIEQIRKSVKLERVFYDQLCEHNRKIREEEKPRYTTNAKFIAWVRRCPNLIQNYLSDKDKTKTEVNDAFPNLPQTTKDRFLKELDKKAKCLSEFIELKQNMTPLKIPEKRLWQLVEQTADLIERVHAGRRSTVGYNMVVQTQGEAQFVMELIYEWSWNEWPGEIDSNFIEEFHGPETHIWGTGPRIPHFNAGVYVDGRLRSVHVYFIDEKEKTFRFL